MTSLPRDNDVIIIYYAILHYTTTYTSNLRPHHYQLNHGAIEILVNIEIAFAVFSFKFTRFFSLPWSAVGKPNFLGKRRANVPI